MLEATPRACESVPRTLLATTHYRPLSGKADIPENYNVVTYELREAGSHTRVLVTHGNNPDQAMVNESEKTWTMILGRLKTAVEAEDP